MIIYLREARKILGKEISDKMSDDELENMILSLTNLAKYALEQARNDRLADKTKPMNST